MSFKSALSHPGFRRLWASQAISSLGDSIHEIALIWIVYEVTGDPALLSLVVVASLLPLALTSLPAGVFVDRWDRKRVLVWTTFFRGATVLCIPVVGTHYPAYLVPTVLVVAFVTGFLQAFFNPAKTAVVPNLVPAEDLDAANALTEMTRNVSKFLYALGGLLVAYVGSYVAFYADAASFFVAGALLVALPDSIRHRDESTDDGGLENVYADLKTGLSFVRDSPVVLSLILLSALTGFVLGPLSIVLPVFARQSLDANSVTFGYLYASIYVGALLGGVVVDGCERTVAAARGKVVIAGVLGMGMALLSLVAIQRFVVRPILVSLVGMVAFGICFTVVQIPIRTLAQSLVPDDVRGRVFSVWSAVGLVTPPASVALVGLALTRVGVLHVFLAQGILTIGAGLLLSCTALSNVGGLVEVGTAENATNR